MLKKLKKKDMVNIKMKTKVEDINRNIYDIKNEDNYDFKMEKGINEEIVKEGITGHGRIQAYQTGTGCKRCDH